MQPDHDEYNPDAAPLREVNYEFTPQLPVILEHLGASLLVTTYQAGKLLSLGVSDGKLTIAFLDYDQPMGLAVSPTRIALGTRKQIHFLVQAHETQANQKFYDGCFVPRTSSYTGSIHGHDLGWGNDGLWIVNTLFSCLATLHEDYSFVPRWRPPFISQLIDQDRCHLNGMAIVDGVPKFVTALGETDTAAGWRPNKANGGIVMEVPSGEVVCRGLSMPHSPRFHHGRLWVLDSGRGALGYVDPNTGAFETVATVPGYARGLALLGQFAFVGLSKIRETAVFGGVPIAENRDELNCGVGVIDLLTGNTVAVFKFNSLVSEIFAVEAIPHFKNPLIAGASVDQRENEVWIVPAEKQSRPVIHKRFPIFGNSFSAAEEITEAPSVEQLLLASQRHRAVGDLAASAALLERAIAVTSSPAGLLVDLGNLRQDQNQQHEAAICYQRAVAADPACTAAWQNLGYLWFNMGEAEKADDAYRKLIAQDPSPLNRLLASSVLPVVYDSVEDMEYWRDRQLALLRDLAADRQTVDATQSLVPTCFFAAYQGRCDREIMQLRGQIVQGRDFTTHRSKPYRSDDRRRVAFISAYFRDHTIGRLNIGRLEQLDRTRMHLTVISAGSASDPLAERFKKTADEFVVLPRDIRQAIQVLQQVDIDVLIFADVGMDALVSTLAFSRFAPLQLATWGHPETTGSPMIDAFLSSEALESASGQEHYTEQLWKLPSLGIRYERPQLGASHRKTRRDFGLPEEKHIYACPQTLFKFHPEFDDILKNVLEADPLAELVLLEGRLPEWTHRLRRRFRRTLPEADRRVRFLPALPRDDFLQLLAISDVVLDPIHFGGGNSSMEALAMGVPLVTLEGSFLRSRITSAMYREIGLTALIAKDHADYSRLAVRLACEPDFRRSICEELSQKSGGFFENKNAAKEIANCLC